MDRPLFPVFIWFTSALFAVSMELNYSLFDMSWSFTTQSTLLRSCRAGQFTLFLRMLNPISVNEYVCIYFRDQLTYALLASANDRE